MFKKQIPIVNASLEKTRKAIIALGCSFVQGQGAINDEIYANYKLKDIEFAELVNFELTTKEKYKLLSQYSNLSIRGLGAVSDIDFTFMEYKNAFVNVLCEKWFNGEYTPINFGQRGCGNRATIKELYFYPNIRWDLMDEIIVIYCPSGLERFDFINDSFQDHFRWKCMWPHFDNVESSGRKLLWKGYANHLHSDRFEILEQISHVQELMLWCKLHNARLIITPGFDRRYTKEHFENSLGKVVVRDKHGDFVGYDTPPPDLRHVEDQVSMFPWDKMFRPDGHGTFMDLVMAQEPDIEKTDFYFQFHGKGSPNRWITPCSHPSQKGHDLFAGKLYDLITAK